MTVKLFRIALVALFTCLVTTLSAQTITGNVKDSTGEPILGATIMETGTKNGTVTDMDGNFTIKLQSAGNLSVSYIGMQTQVVKTAGKTTVNVTLEDDNTTLNEVVVVGYGTMKKSDLTGSVSSVSTDDIVQKGSSSVMEALQGSVPGVAITKSGGRIGGGFNVEIRGKSSTNSDTTPMYVVDGVICDDIDFLNEQDIERIDVLKDASSTAIYGSRATAGVIMVTTKSGKSVGSKTSTKPTISYDGYYGVTKMTRMPDFMGTTEFAQYRFLRFLEFGEPNSATAQSGQPNYVMNNYSQAMLCDEINGPQTAEHSVLRKMMENGQSTDWTKLLTQTGKQQNHYLSVSGGNTDINYHIGAGYTGQEGIYQGDKSNRISLKGSLDAKINKYVSAGFTMNLAYMKNEYAYENAVADAFSLNAFCMPYDNEGNLIFAPGKNTALNTDGNQFSDGVNPIYKTRAYEKESKTYRMLGSFYVQVTPIKGLILKTNFQPDFQSYRESEFYDPTEMQSLGARDSDLHSGWTTLKAYYNTSTSMSYIWDNTITWDKVFAKKHAVNVMGLASFSHYDCEKNNKSATGIIPAQKWWNMGAYSTEDGGYSSDGTNNSYGENSMISYAVRANYTYDSKYMLTATIRWDGSSKFADGHRWGSFPSVAVAWRASEEKFLKSVDWLSNLKLRLSYGVTGNNKGAGNYQTYQSLAGPVYYPMGGVWKAGYYSGNPVDQSISWETSNEVNFGIDFSFLRSRINGTIDLYNKTSKDLLYKVNLPIESGGGTMLTNVGKVNNRGIEVSLNTVNILNKDWRWETTFTFAKNKNKVKEINGQGTDIYPNDDKVADGLFIGYSVNNLYGYEWKGIVSDRDMIVPDNKIAKSKGLTPGTTMRECDYYYTCYGLVEGNPLIDDKNGDGVIDKDDKRIYTCDPSWTGSFATSLAWKNWDFNMSLYAKVGGYVYSSFLASSFYKYSDRGTQHMNFDYYIPAGTLIACDGINDDGTYINPTYQQTTHYGDYPLPVNAGNAGLGVVGTQYEACRGITKISYVKVKNITLGYTLPKTWLNKVGLKTLRLYCTVTNPFVFTNYKGYDPEWASASTSDDGPSTITWEFGANIKF